MVWWGGWSQRQQGLFPPSRPATCFNGAGGGGRTLEDPPWFLQGLSQDPEQI